MTAAPLPGPSFGPLDRLILLVYAALCAAFALLAPFPAGFDELAHVSHVAHVLEHGDPAPALDDLRLLEADGSFAWSGEPNYLNHPSFYYVVMAALVAPFGAVDGLGVTVLRLANVLLSVGGLALALGIGARAGWSMPARAAFAVALATVPTLAVLGGLVTNDNLAWLGGALCCMGGFELLRAGPSRRRMAWMVGGFALASLAKLTAALLCGGLVVAIAVTLALRHGRRPFADPWVCAILVVGALALAPYVALLVEHGSPAPFTAGQAAALGQRLAAIPEWQMQRLDFAGYAGHFALSLLMFWPPVIPRTDLAILLLAIPSIGLALVVAGLAWTIGSATRRALTPIEQFVLCGALALAAVIAIHLGFTFLRHLETGWLKGVYPRYYFPLLPVLPAAAALVIARLGWRRIAAVASVALVGYGAIAGVDVARALF